jgi:hypothetical protein
MEKIDKLPENMVLIKQKSEARIINRTDRWGQQMPGFYINQPLVGFVTKEFWEDIDTFQNLKLGKDSEVLNKMVTIGEKVTKDDLLKHTDLQKWIDLQNKTKNFYNTVAEFVVLVGVDVNGEEEYKRTAVLLGEVTWEVINF